MASLFTSSGAPRAPAPPRVPTLFGASGQPKQSAVGAAQRAFRSTGLPYSTPPQTTHPAAAAPAAQPAPAATNPSDSSSPLDATYFQQAAQNTTKLNNQIAGLGLQDTQNHTALQSALAQLAYQQPRDQLSLEQKYNNAGGLYSSVYDQALGNLNYNFLGKQGAATTKYTNAHDKIANEIANLQEDIPIDNAGFALASTIRASNKAAGDPSLGAPPPAAPAPAPAPAPVAAPGPLTAPASTHALANAIAAAKQAPPPKVPPNRVAAASAAANAARGFNKRERR